MKDAIRQEQKHDIEPVFVGSAGHLLRYKVVGLDGKCVKHNGNIGLFRTRIEAEKFIDAVENEGE